VGRRLRREIPFHIEHRGRERYRINATLVDDPQRMVHVVNDNGACCAVLCCAADRCMPPLELVT
jgi:hypothetical protein